MLGNVKACFTAKLPLKVFKRTMRQRNGLFAVHADEVMSVFRRNFKTRNAVVIDIALNDAVFLKRFKVTINGRQGDCRARGVRKVKNLFRRQRLFGIAQNFKNQFALRRLSVCFPVLRLQINPLRPFFAPILCTILQKKSSASVTPHQSL